MPIDSIHWWGSYVGWDGVEPPELQPTAWRIGFWSNVPPGAVDPDIYYSYPDKLLWQIEVPADRVKSEWVGSDEFPQRPLETCFQYYVDLEPNEVFWQHDFIRRTKDNIFWLSIAAVYPPDTAIVFPWGWKTRPWSWMDDAVWFEVYRDPLPGMRTDPISIVPIEEPTTGESFDVAFELDTDPNWVKWEQPFTGIRHWPHYEDELSMGIVRHYTKIKWLQPPDIEPQVSIDVDATTEGQWPPQILADDFLCQATGPITDIHIWGSWYHDYLPAGSPLAVTFTLSIHEDIPADVSPTGYSMPGKLLWMREFQPGRFDAWIYAQRLEEGWYVPCLLPPYYEPYADSVCWQYDFHINPDEAFHQEEGTIYWLDVQARPVDRQARFGWKTSTDHWNDDAVFAVGYEPYEDVWGELRYPDHHPYAGKSIDLAFALTTETEELDIARLVADDWPCEVNTPVTAATWWGSYIGYRYEACQPEVSAPPVKPDYFLLRVWDDVPAGVDLPYSHPNNVIWEYKAYDYDEVLVGYDKHPEGGLDVAICGAPSGGPTWNDDVQAKLMATGQFGTVDIIDVHTITPTLAQLQAYDAVLVYSDNTYADSNALGNVMADYVDSGGGVVCAMFEIGYGSGLPHPLCQMRGRWDAQGYYVIPRTQQYGPPQATLGTVYDPTHPIMQGVSSFDGGTSSFRPIYTTTIPPGSTRVADWNDTSPLVVTKTISGVPRADLGLYPPSSDARSDFWVSSTDGALLMANALAWVAGASSAPARPREPVFRYSVRLPKEAWFHQEDVNNIYWFSVTAVYDGSAPNYDWGWTNHAYVAKDDAVAGYLELSDPPVWFWEELFDQTGVSEDMSFILFTWPWPPCWGYLTQCHGDADGDGSVKGADFLALKNSWYKCYPDPLYDPCADFDRNGCVKGSDFLILKTHWYTSPPADCPRGAKWPP
jgi:hypothetical protein